MKLLHIFFGLVFAAGFCVGQEATPTPVDVAHERHHEVVLQNRKIRVLRLKLERKQATAPHRHAHYFAFLSVRPARIANEVRGRAPVITELAAGEVHTSRGGFVVAERNMNTESAEVLVIESMQSGDGRSFGTPMGGFKVHDAAVGEVFESPHIRAYAVTLASGGRTESHEEQFDRLLVAVSDLKLTEEVEGQPTSELQMKAGDVRWLPRGRAHATTNAGDEPATFVTFEVN